MNRPVRLALAGGALLAATAALGSAAMADRTLLYSTYLSSDHHIVTQAVEPFSEAVATATDGSITFDISVNGALASAKETLSAIRDKAIDAGYIVDIYTPAALPETAMLSGLALLVQDPWVATGAMNETILLNCPACRERLKENNVVPLGIVSTSTFSPMCTSEIKTVADLQGKKIRATSAWANWVNAVGGVAVNIPSSEIYEALQRGQADCSMGPPSHLPNYSLYEVVKYVTDLPLGAYMGALVLNVRADIWAEMTETEKRAMIDNAAVSVTGGVAGYVDGDAAAKAEGEKQGIVWVQPADDLVQLYTDYKPKLVEEIIADAKEKGLVEDPAALIAIFTEKLAKWDAIVADAKGDRAVFTQALQDEIYSKLTLD